MPTPSSIVQINMLTEYSIGRHVEKNGKKCKKKLSDKITFSGFFLLFIISILHVRGQQPFSFIKWVYKTSS